MARITLNLHGTDGDQSVFRTALAEFLAEWPEHATIRDESRGDVYAETYEKMLDVREHGEHVIIDMDPGMFRMTLHGDGAGNRPPRHQGRPRTTTNAGHSLFPRGLAHGAVLALRVARRSAYRVRL